MASKAPLQFTPKAPNQGGKGVTIGSVAAADPIDPEDVVKSIGWFARNLPTVFAWVKYIGEKMKPTAKSSAGPAAVILMSIVMGGGCGTFFRIVGNLPDIPPPPTATPTFAPPPDVTATPLPPPGPTSPSTPSPSPTPTPVPAPTVTPSPSPVPPPPTSTPTTPSSTPTPVCIPRPGPNPVTLIYKGGCPRYMEVLDFEGEGNNNMPDSQKTCGIRNGEGNGRTAWRLGFGLGRQHMELQRFGDAWLQFDPGRGCTDAYGRHFADCFTLYTNPDYPDAAYGWGGYSEPASFCGDATPTPVTPVPVTPVPTSNPSCAPVVAIGHSIAPGDHCHVVRDSDGACLIDSTIRPICDRDHMENWNTICGNRDHDPDYAHARGTQDWRFTDAEDLGPNDHGEGDERTNFAQRWIRITGPHPTVEVCLKEGAVTADGCPLTRQGDGCGRRDIKLPAQVGERLAQEEKWERERLTLLASSGQVHEVKTPPADGIGLLVLMLVLMYSASRI